MDPRISVAIDRSFGPLFYRFHRWVLVRSGGRVMSSAMGLPMVVLETNGARTGLRRRTALLAYRASESRYIVVPSNGGRDRSPDWLANIDADPRVRLLGDRQWREAHARRASAEEKASYFPAMGKAYSGWPHYETLTSRQIPIVLVDLD